MIARTDRFALAGMFVCAAGAAVASADALAALASRTGWSGWASWLLPLAVDCLAAVALRVWLDPSASAPARRFARRAALAAVVASMAGNAASHLVDTGDLAVGVPLIVVVGAAPAAALGAVAHLHALRTAPVPGRVRRTQATPAAAPSAAPPFAAPSASPSAGSRSRTADRPRKSATGTTRTSAIDRAVAAWTPGTDVTGKWVQTAAGCGRTLAFEIRDTVAERVRTQSVLKLADRQETTA